ncbi:hypothetical protein Hanom_Chr15g01370261 [Helianthus anomalus]
MKSQPFKLTKLTTTVAVQGGFSAGGFAPHYSAHDLHFYGGYLLKLNKITETGSSRRFYHLYHLLLQLATKRHIDQWDFVVTPPYFQESLSILNN